MATCSVFGEQSRAAAAPIPSPITYCLMLVCAKPCCLKCAGLMPTAHSAGPLPSSSNSSGSGLTAQQRSELRTFLQNLPATNATNCVDRELQWLKAETFNLTKPAVPPCTKAEADANRGERANTAAKAAAEAAKCGQARLDALKRERNKTAGTSVCSLHCAILCVETLASNDKKLPVLVVLAGSDLPQNPHRAVLPIRHRWGIFNGCSWTDIQLLGTAIHDVTCHVELVCSFVPSCGLFVPCRRGPKQQQVRSSLQNMPRKDCPGRKRSRKHRSCVHCPGCHGAEVEEGGCRYEHVLNQVDCQLFIHSSCRPWTAQLLQHVSMAYLLC